MDSNPLKQFFRQPAIYLRLPGKGKGWAPGSIDMPANGEIPIYPMTAIDEITYRTPDALFNGEAVVSVIQSCVPAIKDAWAAPATDLDSIMVAIRIASYGHTMDIGTKCPNCDTDNEFGLDLRSIIDNLKSADYDQTLTLGDLTFKFRPLDYREMTKNSQIQFEQQKILQMINNEEVPEENKVTQLNEMMKKILDVTVLAIAETIEEIRTNSAIVSEKDFILDFLKNCDRQLFDKIKNTVLKLREDSELKPLNITCPSCQHKYQQAFTLDMARFFGSAS